MVGCPLRFLGAARNQRLQSQDGRFLLRSQVDWRSGSKVWGAKDEQHWKDARHSASKDEQLALERAGSPMVRATCRHHRIHRHPRVHRRLR